MVKPSMVESFQYQMLRTKNMHGRKYKPASANRAVALLKRIYNLAIREDMVIKNPCWKVSMLPEKNERDRVITHEEFERLIEALPDHLKPITKVGYYTGMRVGEILGLTWDQVNMQEGYIDLSAEDTKTSEPRRIYFNDELEKVFREAGRVRSLKHSHVFTYRNRPMQRFTRAFQNATRKAGIEDFKFHDLRHTFNTNMRKAGVDHTVIMKLTGHKTMAMFNRYNTVDREDAYSAMEKLTGYLGTVFSQKSSDIVQTAPKKGLTRKG